MTEHVPHEHRYRSYPVAFDHWGFACEKAGCRAVVLCPHCSCELFDLGLEDGDDGEGRMTWTCWKCHRDVTAHVDSHRHYSIGPTGAAPENRPPEALQRRPDR